MLNSNNNIYMPVGLARLCVVLVLALAANIGCNKGDGIDRRTVVGSVTFDGKPLPHGNVEFCPSDGPISGAPIVDGKYSIEHKGGVTLGKHKVSITAYRVNETLADADALTANNVGGDRQYVPKKYNDETDLSVEVTTGRGPQEVNFDLEK